MLDPSFNLLANRGVGKIAFISLVIWHIVLFLWFQKRAFMSEFLRINILFVRQRWLFSFFAFFTLFASAHGIMLFVLWFSGWITLHPITLSYSLIPKILWGFVATFFLAWSEELIFRGTLYTYIAQEYKPLTSAIITSFIFMGAHDLTNPLNLVTTQWKLGLGLFLLGLLLNCIFIITKKLYVGMGAHAGLVFIKVALRRLPIIQYAAPLPIYLDPDLRKSLVVHLFFACIIFLMIYKYRRHFFSNKTVE